MAIHRQDILEALGIERGRHHNDWMMQGLAGFGIGCIVGAAVAILLAPKSGAELRGDLMERGRDLMHKRREHNENKSPDTPGY